MLHNSWFPHRAISRFSDLLRGKPNATWWPAPHILTTSCPWWSTKSGIATLTDSIKNPERHREWSSKACSVPGSSPGRAWRATTEAARARRLGRCLSRSVTWSEFCFPKSWIYVTEISSVKKNRDRPPPDDRKTSPRKSAKQNLRARHW